VQREKDSGQKAAKEGLQTMGLRTTREQRAKGKAPLSSTKLRVLRTEWVGMRIENRGLKIEKGRKERSGRYAPCALLYAIFRLR